MVETAYSAADLKRHLSSSRSTARRKQEEEESLFLKIDLDKLKKLHRDKLNRRSKSRSSQLTKTPLKSTQASTSRNHTAEKLGSLRSVSKTKTSNKVKSNLSSVVQPTFASFMRLKSPYTETVVKKKIAEFPRHRFVPETVPNTVLMDRDSFGAVESPKVVISEPRPQKSVRRSRAQRLQNHQRTGSMGGSTSQKRISDPVTNLSPLVEKARQSK